jgi:hypothetical protein
MDGGASGRSAVARIAGSGETYGRGTDDSGAGYIGSHAPYPFPDTGAEVVVLDDLSAGASGGGVGWRKRNGSRTCNRRRGIHR